MTRWNTKINNEEKEKIKLAEYLDMKGYCWCHVPNEGKHKVQYRKKQAKKGLKAGVPDVLIFDNPGDIKMGSKLISGVIINGIAIELKRKKGGSLQESQKKWLKKLDERDWITNVCYGADEAIKFLENIFKECDNE